MRAAKVDDNERAPKQGTQTRGGPRLLTVRVRRRLLTVWGGLAVWIGLLTIGVMRLAAGITRRPATGRNKLTR